MRQLFNHEVNEISGGSYSAPTLTETLTVTAKATGIAGAGNLAIALICTGIRANLGLEHHPVTTVVLGMGLASLLAGGINLGLAVYHDPEILNR